MVEALTQDAHFPVQLSAEHHCRAGATWEYDPHARARRNQLAADRVDALDRGLEPRDIIARHAAPLAASRSRRGLHPRDSSLRTLLVGALAHRMRQPIPDFSRLVHVDINKSERDFREGQHHHQHVVRGGVHIFR